MIIIHIISILFRVFSFLLGLDIIFLLDPLHWATVGLYRDSELLTLDFSNRIGIEGTSGFHPPSDTSSSSEMDCCRRDICKSAAALLEEAKLIHGRRAKMLHLVKGCIKIIPLENTRDIRPLTYERIASTMVLQRVKIYKLIDRRFYNHPFNNIMEAVRLRIIKEVRRKGLRTKEKKALEFTIVYMETLIHERDRRPTSSK
jgi:hypothetical protein